MVPVWSMQRNAVLKVERKRKNNDSRSQETTCPFRIAPDRLATRIRRARRNILFCRIHNNSRRVYVPSEGCSPQASVCVVFGFCPICSCSITAYQGFAPLVQGGNSKTERLPSIPASPDHGKWEIWGERRPLEKCRRPTPSSFPILAKPLSVNSRQPSNFESHTGGYGKLISIPSPTSFRFCQRNKSEILWPRAQ